MMDHLPERDRPAVKARLRRAWSETDHDRALEQLRRLADELEHTHPGAAGSLREGMVETLNVSGLRWTAAGMLEAERQFRRVIGYQDLAKLAVAIERDLTHRRQSSVTHPPIEKERIPATV